MTETWQEELLRDGTLRRQGLETIYGSPAMSDRDLALDMLATGKFGVSLLARALTETTSRRLRQLLLNQFHACLQEYFQLADLAAARGWYQPSAPPGPESGT